MPKSWHKLKEKWGRGECSRCEWDWTRRELFPRWGRGECKRSEQDGKRVKLFLRVGICEI